MRQTETLGLNILPPEEEATTFVRDLLRAIAGTDASNMQKIDEAIKDLRAKAGGSVVWSETEPQEAQSAGGIWNQIVRVE